MKKEDMKKWFCSRNLMYSTQKLIKSTKRDNSVPTIQLKVSSPEEIKTYLSYFLYFILLIAVCNFYFNS